MGRCHIEVHAQGFRAEHAEPVMLAWGHKPISRESWVDRAVKQAGSKTLGSEWALSVAGNGSL